MKRNAYFYGFALGCLMLTAVGLAQKPEQKGTWTPPATSYSPAEIASMPDVLLPKAGTKLPLSLKTPLSGKWTAEYGVIDAQGNYEAPPYTPAGGDDTITFTHGDNRFPPILKPGQLLPPPKPLPPDYKMLTLTIRILPNPSIAGSGATPYIVLAPVDSVDENGEEQRLSDGPKIVFPKQFPLPAEKFLRTRAVLKPGEKLSAPVEVTHVLPVALSRNKTAYLLPAHNQFNHLTDTLRVRTGAIQFVPQRAKELPQYTGTPFNNPDVRMGTRPDVRAAIKKWLAAGGWKKEAQD